MSARDADRRIPRSAALRRLITAGNLLAAAARGQVTATPELADIWDSSVEVLRADLAEPPIENGGRSYVTFETVGACEICGATDNHLIEGVCPTCRPKVTVTMCPPPRQQGKRAALNRMVETAARALTEMANTDEVPLGAEADVSHVHVPKGGAR